MAASIAARIRRAMLAVALGLTMAFATLTLLLLYVTEDQLFLNQIRVEQHALEGADASEWSSWQPGNRQMRLVWDKAALPAMVAAHVGQAPGVYEYFAGGKAYFVLRGQLPLPASDYFLLYDVSNLLAVRQIRPVLIGVLIAGVLAVAVVAMLGALILARNTLRPLRQLTGKLQSGEEDDLPAGFAAEFAGDEVGVLAEALESALQRVQAASVREFEFNRGVSHELRTPIQVAKNAVELLQMDPKENARASSAKVTGRLARAVEQMETVTEAFLWMASSRTTDESRTNAEAAIKALVTDHMQPIGANAVAIEVESDDIEYAVPPPVFSVVVGNLLRNAVQHADGNRVRCVLSQESIVIEDGGSGAAQSVSTKGYGIGLAIVERICERLGWTLSLTQGQAGGMRAHLRVPIARS